MKQNNPGSAELRPECFSHYCGYRYFIRAVELALEDPTEAPVYSQRNLRHRSIRVCSTTVSSVERNIRTVRDVMMRNGGHHLLVEMTRLSGLGR